MRKPYFDLSMLVTAVAIVMGTYTLFNYVPIMSQVWAIISMCSALSNLANYIYKAVMMPKWAQKQSRRIESMFTEE